MYVAISQMFTLEKVRSTNTESEASLVKGLKQVERTAQNECYRRFSGKMYPTAIRYTSSKADADEVINTAFLKVFTSINKYTHKGKFEGWIRTIVKRTSIDYCRKHTYNQITTTELLDIDLPIYNEAINNLSAEDFLKVIIRLPKASRTVFNLFAIEGYSHAEISNELGISKGTSKWHLSNARRILMDLINAQNK